MTLPAYNSGNSISLDQIRTEFAINVVNTQVWDPSSTTFYYNISTYYWRDSFWSGSAPSSPGPARAIVWNGVLITNTLGFSQTTFTTGIYTYTRGTTQASVGLGTSSVNGFTQNITGTYFSISRYFFSSSNVNSDPNPVNFIDYYAGAASGFVPSGTVGFVRPSGVSTSIPSSGQMSFNNFFGATKALSYAITQNINYQGVYNVRQQFIAAGWNGTSPINGTVTINAGVYIYRSQYDTSAFSIASVEIQGFPAGSIINLVNNGFIYGFGGQGGNGGNMAGAASGSSGDAGNSGGTGLYVSASGFTVRVTNNGTIAGGGGGGGGGGSAYLFVPPDGKSGSYTVGAGGGGGGGGAPNGNGGSRAIITGYGINYNPTNSGNNAVFPNSAGNGSVGAGGPPFGGSGNIGGTVANAGSPGTSSTSGTSNGGGGAGGAAGAAVQGNSFITWIAFGTRLGAIT